MSKDIKEAAAKAALATSEVISLNGKKYCFRCYIDKHRTTCIRQTREKDLYNCPYCAQLYKDKTKL